MTSIRSKKNSLNSKNPIITTKLFVPPQKPNLVRRPRLVEILNKGLDCKLILISAPAGFGKTTLLSEWINQTNIPVSWFSINKNDNDVLSFLTYFVTALQSIEQEIGRTAVSILQSTQLASPEYLLANLINDITTYPKDFIFVFEDYHHIGNRQIHSIVEFLLNHIPLQMHLVIDTRSDPFLPLARLRSTNQMIELRATDLCFTTEETSFYFNKIMNLKLSSENIDILKSRTEGWAAGLQMAALSMKNRKDISGFIKTFAGDDRHIMDYLLEEVLNRQSDFIKSFLLKTSILDRLSGSLCNAITEQENCQKTLQDLEAANLFVVPLDNKRQWYRYHHLFADLLQIHLNQSLPDMVPELHRRASKWHQQNNLIDEAIIHSLAANDFEQAARLTEQTFIDRMSRGEDFATMLHRLEALPDNIVRNSATLNIMYAYMLSITLQLDKVEPRLKQVEKKFKNQLTEDLRRQITLIRADLARHKYNYIEAIALSRQILKELPKNPSFVDMQTLTGCIFNLAWAFLLKGDTANAQHYFSEALKISRAANSITLSLLSLSGLGRTQIWQGQLRRAFETLQQGVQLAEHEEKLNGQIVPASVYIHLALGELFREWDRLEEANYHLTKIFELGRQYQIDGETLRDGYLIQCRVKQAIGDIPAALKIVKQAEQLAREYQSVRGFILPIKICWAWLMMGQIASTDVGDSNLEEVRKWIESRNLELKATIGSIVEESEFLIWIHLLITQNKPKQVKKLLAHLYQEAENGGRVKSMIEILILQALAFQIHGEIPEAIISVQKALEIAEPEGFIRIFLDEGKLLAELLNEIKHSGKLNMKEPKNKILHKYIEKILQKFKLSILQKKQTGLVDPLSERELEVLRLIKTGLTNLEIGEHLFISLNTVRTHTKNINSKLNVNSRTQAIARAKELGIIE